MWLAVKTQFGDFSLSSDMVVGVHVMEVAVNDWVVSAHVVGGESVTISYHPTKEEAAEAAKEIMARIDEAKAFVSR